VSTKADSKQLIGIRRQQHMGNAQSAYYARWLQSKSNSIGFRNQEERNMFPGMPDQLIGEPVGVLFHSSFPQLAPERVAALRGIRAQYDEEERLNAPRQYCAVGHCASSKSEWDRQYGKN
jgi:hypothetical protein